MSPQDDIAGNGPLTPEERALAQRLARLGAQAEPSSALDARILAAAHAASAEAAPDATPMRRRSDRRPARRPARWPAVFGFAASLALACGIAWQLRPVPPVPASMERAAPAEEPLATYTPPAPAMSVRMLPPKPLNIPVPPPAAAERRAPARRAEIRDATPADAERKPQAFDAPAFDENFLDEAVPMPSQAPLPAAEAAAVASDAAAAPTGAAPALQRAAPAAPAAPPAAAPAAAKSAANALRREAAVREADAAVREAQAARMRQEPEFAEPDEEVVPPATADDPDVRAAWLERIRELLRDGDPDAARESLRAFRTRYPAHVLPEDLRPLEE